MNEHVLKILKPAEATPAPLLPDGAISGNGDVTVTLAGSADRVQLYISKADFWKGDGRSYTEYRGGLSPLALVEILLPHLAYADYKAEQNLDEAYISRLLKKLAHPCVILTGVGYREGETGAAIYKNGTLEHYTHPRIGRNLSGTGDMFAACFTGALLQEQSLSESVKIAADFVCKAIENTCAAPAHWYGVKFETVLPELIRWLNN
jgi:hypothetical protein